MLLVKKEAIYHPFEDFSFPHAALPQKHGGHGPSGNRFERCAKKIVQVLPPVGVNFFRHQGADGPGGNFVGGGHVRAFRV